MEQSNISIDEWLEAEQSLRAIHKLPEGYVTTAQYAHARCLSQSRARHILRELIKAGKAERIRIHQGHTYAYRLTK